MDILISKEMIKQIRTELVILSNTLEIMAQEIDNALEEQEK